MPTPATPVITDDVKYKLLLEEGWEQDAFAVREHFKDFVIESEEDHLEAARKLTQVKGCMKALDAERSELVGPFNKHVKKINARYKPATDALEQVESRLKNQIARWIQSQREKQQQLLLAAQAAAASQTVTDPEYLDMRRAAELVEQAKLAAPARTDGVSGRDVWVIEVTDPDLVPRDFCSPDLAKLQKAVDAGIRAIPGVRITAAVQVRARAS